MEVEPKTPSRASFAGLSNRRRDSPSLKDIVNSLMSDRDKAFKLAITNAIAILLVVFILIILYWFKLLLMDHIRPLSLALLFGSFLHPMKRSLSLFLKQILKEICDDDVPILAFISTPFRLINRLTNQLPLKLLAHLKELANFGKTLLKGDYVSATLVCLVAISLFVIGGNTLMKIVILVNLIPFFNNHNKGTMTISDCSLHFLIHSFIMTQICWFRMELLYLLLPIALIKLLLWLACKLYVIAREKLSEQLEYYDDDEADGEDNAEAEMEAREAQDSLDPPEYTPRRPIRRNEDAPKSERVNRSRYRPVNDPQSSAFLKTAHELLTKLSGLPSWTTQVIEDLLDTISTTCVIGLMIFIVILTTLFLSFQIYAESVYLIEKLSVSANTLFRDNPDLPFIPGGMTAIHNMLEGAVKDAYEHGREWIRNSIRQLINNAAKDDFNSTQSSLIEKQMVEFWDRTYSMYVNGSNMNDATTLTIDRKSYDWSRLVKALQSLNFALCAQILNQNWNTLVSVMDSLSKILKGNLNLALGIVTAIFSALIMSGSAVLNFLINLIVFTTTLYYLLCSSGDQYKPIELVKKLLPRDTRMKRHMDSVDESINTAFTAFIKMMLFHGLSTWILHRLFDLKVVFIPSVISAIFGALPFVSPFWASVPACIDLCMAGSSRQAIIMGLLAYGPSSYVSTEFYSEIKNAGHPYLISLAIGGGLVAFGIEGALFGPMLLVCIRLLVIIVNGYL